jgi:hypothetical protein
VVFAIAEVPYTRDEIDIVVGSAQVGVAASLAGSRWGAVHGRLAGLGGFVSGGDGDRTDLGLVASVDGTVRTVPWLVVVVGGEARLGWDDPLVAARAGVHWRLRGPWRLEAAVRYDIGGDDPFDAALVMGVRRDR